jgi:hypothetical protein
MVLTRLSTLLLLFLGIALLPFWQESFAQTDPVGASGQQRSSNEPARVRGRVIVTGDYQNPKPLPVFKNRSFCGARVPSHEQSVLLHYGQLNSLSCRIVLITRHVVKVIDESCGKDTSQQVARGSCPTIRREFDSILGGGDDR